MVPSFIYSFLLKAKFSQYKHDQLVTESRNSVFEVITVAAGNFICTPVLYLERGSELVFVWRTLQVAN